MRKPIAAAATMFSPVQAIRDNPDTRMMHAVGCSVQSPQLHSTAGSKGQHFMCKCTVDRSSVT
ncbi:MAG: hypothetical protein WBB96_10055 [Candidatus Dechloromonas phosphoritropha]|jgi:hypothetical protein